MQKNNTQSGTLLLLLARRADSLCSAIQSWAIAHRWGDLLLCHSVYDLLTRLDDIAPQQSVVLIGRPAMLTEAFLTAVRQKHPSLRLIHWSPADQTIAQPLAQPITGLGGIVINSVDQLDGVIQALAPVPVFEQIARTADDGPAAKAKFDPKDYRLSNDEINALLGDG